MTQTIQSSRAWFAFSTLFLSLLSGGSAAAANGPSGFSYEGRLYDSSGNPSSATVRLTLSIYNPAGNCLLRSEQSTTLDLSTTNGYFSVTVGQGTVTAQDPGLTMTKIFANTGTITGGSSCVYTPQAGDGRLLRVQINDSGTVTTLSPDVPIGAAPYAVVSDTVQGKAPTDFIQVNSLGAQLTQANLESVFATAANVSELQALINGTSTRYTPMSPASGVVISNVAGSPSSPVAGAMWFDTSSSQLKYHNGTSVMTVGAGGGGSGTVTSITAGAGLSGGTISTTGTISMPNVGTAGTYYKVTTDAQGRVSSGASSLVEADIPNLAAAGKVSGSAVSGSINVGAGNSVTATNVSSTTDSTQNLRVFESTNTYKVTLSVPAGLAADWSFVLPSTPGSASQVLTTDGAGNLSWSTPGGGGTVTSVSGTLPISVATGATTPVISISQATTSTDGYLSSTDWNSFNNKLGSSLISGKIFVGNGSNLAAQVVPSGDLSMTNTGAFTVSKIQGVAVNATAPAVAGQVLRYDGTSSYVPAQLSTSDITGLSTALGNKIDASQMPANCGANQTLTFSSPAGSWTCSTINGLTLTQGGTGSTTGSIMGSGALTFAAGGTNQNVTLTPSGTGYTILNGSVGIGTTAPIAPFHYQTASGNADAIITSQTGNAELLLTGPSGSFYPGVALSYFPGPQEFQITKVTNGSPNPYPWVVMNGATGIYKFSSVTGGSAELKMDLQRSNNLAAVTAGMALARIAFDGYNGSGYSASAAMIQGVASETYSASANGTDMLFYTTANGTLTPVERMRVSSGGNVGIGTTMPASKLDVAGSVKVGSDATACSGTIQGAIRLNGTALEYCNGTVWSALASGGAALSTAGGTLSGNLTINSGGLTVAAGPNSLAGGLNNNSGGITNAGAITGVGANIAGSGAMTIAAGGTNQNLNLNSSTTGSVNLGTGSGIGLQVADAGAGAVNYVAVKGASSGLAPLVMAAGSDINVGLVLQPKGTGSVAIPNGFFGLGTTNPLQNLHIAGNPNATIGALVQNTSPSVSAQAEYRAKNDVGNAVSLGMNSSSYSAGGLYSSDTAYLVSNSASGLNIGTTYINQGAIRFFTTNGTLNERMRIDPYGNVGIGTSNPSYLLDVNGQIRVGGPGASPISGNYKLANIAWSGGSVSAGSVVTQNISISQATVGDSVVCNPRGVLPPYASHHCFVSAAGNVSLAITNHHTTNPLSGLGTINWDVLVIK